MSALLDLRDAVVASVKAALPSFGVEGHLGRFEAADLQKFMTKAPAVRVAILGLADPKAEGEGLYLYNVRMALYVVTKDEVARMSRDAAALAAVETIVMLAFEQRWGLKFARPAAPATAQNLNSEASLKLGVALWGVAIGQPVRLATTDAGELDALKALWIGVAPDIGAAHRDDYLGPFPEEAAGD